MFKNKATQNNLKLKEKSVYLIIFSEPDSVKLINSKRGHLKGIFSNCLGKKTQKLYPFTGWVV